MRHAPPPDKRPCHVSTTVISPPGDKFFFHPQYAAFAVWSSIAHSKLQLPAQFSVRQRFRNDITFDSALSVLTNRRGAL